MGSSCLTRDRTWAPALGAQSISHRATRDVPGVAAEWTREVWKVAPGATPPGGVGPSGCGSAPSTHAHAPCLSSWEGDLPSLQTQADSSTGRLGGPAEPSPGEGQQDGWREGPWPPSQESGPPISPGPSAPS